jgi:hypothetical protein
VCAWVVTIRWVGASRSKLRAARMHYSWAALVGRWVGGSEPRGSIARV